MYSGNTNRTVGGDTGKGRMENDDDSAKHCWPNEWNMYISDGIFTNQNSKTVAHFHDIL